MVATTRIIMRKSPTPEEMCEYFVQMLTLVETKFGKFE